MSALRRKRALFPTPRRLRELATIDYPLPDPTRATLLSCPDCGAAMTGYRTITAGYRLIHCVPRCLACDGHGGKYGGFGGQRPHYALDPNPRRLRYLADRLAVARFVARERPALIVPAPTVLVPVDLWLFDERPVRGGTVRERLAARNLARWRDEAEARLMG